MNIDKEKFLKLFLDSAQVTNQLSFEEMCENHKKLWIALSQVNIAECGGRSLFLG
jgi:hypothetical protein